MNGYERIKELYLKLENKTTSLSKIVKFLMKKQGMNDFYLNNEKDLKQMMSYINDMAREKAVNNVAVLEDEDVYDLAIKYFSTSDEELGITKKPIQTKEQQTKTNDDVSQLALEI